MTYRAAGNELLAKMKSSLLHTQIRNWDDIASAITALQNGSPKIKHNSCNAFKSGIAFITFDYGIDGVSIEIEKYANCLERFFRDDDKNTVPLHFIGGDFHDKADAVLKPYWKRYRIPDMNGWSKWSGGKWFSKLFYENMPEGSQISDDMAKEIWNQASNFADLLGEYLVNNNISLLIPVNICTNPGNPAVTLAVVMVTEALGISVISSNHDYYWEGGKADRKPNEEAGPRDHFFKNINNRPFFNLFKTLFPWNGKRWLQVNINEPQSEALVNSFGFDKKQVFELGSCISNEFLREYTFTEVLSARRRMAYILSGGSPVIIPVSIQDHIDSLSDWMKNQKPIVCANSSNLELDPTKEGTLYCLQPTRVVGRKRIYKDLKLLTALLNHDKLKNAFKDGSIQQLVFHITGPVPIEHQKDLEEVLNAYVEMCSNISSDVVNRIFIAFSVGTEIHPSLEKKGLEKLCIEDIYKLADIILFPSETEGRGLPIIESGACGVPIVCSRYYPGEVFDGVIGKGLPEEEQIKYVLFPEHDEFSNELLNEIANILLNPQSRNFYAEHNKAAVEKRYGIEMLVKKFGSFVKILSNEG
jgi:glycosyltransferase involved in cell wall biosynthesis